MDGSDIEKHMINSDILTRMRDAKEEELQANRSDILNSMTTKNYWELVFGDLNTWKQKYIGKPGIEEQVVENDDFDPVSFMLSLNPLSADFTSSYDADLIPDIPMVSEGKVETDWISGEPLPAMPAASSL